MFDMNECVNEWMYKMNMARKQIIEKVKKSGFMPPSMKRKMIRITI